MNEKVHFHTRPHGVKPLIPGQELQHNNPNKADEAADVWLL